MSGAKRQAGPEGTAASRVRKAAELGKPSADPGTTAQGADLRQAAGNQALLHLLAGQPGDSAEREAEKAAAAIHRDPAAAPLQRPAPLSPPAVQDASRSPGQPLAPSLRADLEPRFGRDLDAVRVHTGPEAAAEAHALGARAFTQGRDVVFAAGQYAPESREGRGLLAHELTHVVQQSDAGTAALQRAPDPAAATSAPKAPSLPEVLEVGASELLSAQSPKLAVFAKKVLASLQTSPAGTVDVTCYWSPSSTDAADNVPRRVSAEMRAKMARSALIALGIPASVIKADAMDATLLSPPAPPSGSVLIAFSPQSLRLGPPQSGIGMNPQTPPSKPGGKPFSLSMREQAADHTSPAPAAGKDFTPRQGTGGDVAKAFLSLPSVKQAIDDFVAERKQDFKDLSTRGKVATVGTAVVLGAGAVAGIASDPAKSKQALDLLNGVTLPVPWVKGLEVQPLTKDGGVVLRFDFTELFSKPKKPKRIPRE